MMKRIVCIITLIASLGHIACLWAGPANIPQFLTGNGGYGVTSQGEWLVVGEPAICVAHVYRLDYETMLYGDGNGNPGEIFQDVVAGNFACPSVQNRGFGEVVSIDGDVMAVGAPLAKGPKSIEFYCGLGEVDCAAANDDGTVFVYQFDGVQWVEISQTLEALDETGEPTNVEGAEYGYAVSVSGDLIAIGARFDNDNASGKVYLYRFDANPVLAEQAEQIAVIEGDNANDEFGSSLSIWTPQDTSVTPQQVMVGAPGYDLPGISPILDAGAAYLYEIVNDTPVLIDTILINEVLGFIEIPQAVGTEVSVGENLGLLAGLASYPMERIDGNIEPKFQYSRTNGGDVSQSKDVAAFGVAGEGVDIYPNVLNDNADQYSNYHLEVVLNDGGIAAGLATDIRLYKDLIAVNDNNLADPTYAGRVQSLFFPCGYGGELKAFEWKMVSIPCELAQGTTVEEAFNADIFPGLCPTPCGALGEYGVNWVVWEQVDDYVSAQPTVPMPAGAEVVNGKGYWIISDASAKPPGQPVYWNVDETTSSQHSPFDTSQNAGFNPRPESVAGYTELILDPLASADASTQVLLGNPFSRSFNWENVGVSLSSFLGDATIPIGGTELFPIPFFVSITGYKQKPEFDEANPYVALTNTPGLTADNEVPVNAGFWIVINQAFIPTTVNSLFIPFEK